MYKAITRCRVCGNPELQRVLDLGNQMLTGVFPRERHSSVTRGPLRLVRCVGGFDACGLLQLEHSYDGEEMYGDSYGYRSGLNPSMVKHLHSKVARIRQVVALNRGDLVIDIGSNDGTTLSAYPRELSLIGVDPAGAKFRVHYPTHVEIIPSFFSREAIARRHPGRKAKLVTSFAMFYDLEEPISFMRDVRDLLDIDGVWVFEQSYMPLMLRKNAYDAVCHEHLEFYGLRQIKWMADKVGITILDVELNDINGGSLSVTAAPSNTKRQVEPSVAALLREEDALGLDGNRPYMEFASRVSRNRQELRAYVEAARSDGKSICGLGASTKGNVLLQYCGFTNRDISLIGDVNPDKFGCWTPGSWIPIVSEDEMLATKPDLVMVLPWHFRQFFQESIKHGSLTLLFPLPDLAVVPPRCK